MFAPQTTVPMTDLNRLVLIPATFIQFWAGGRFYRAAWRAARHGTTNMDTLVAVGTTAAWAYSVAGHDPTRSGRVGRDRAGHLLRLVDDHHRPGPARTLARGAGQGTHGRRHPPAGRAQSDDGSGRARRHGPRDPARGRRGRRPPARPARRPHPGRRRGRRRRVGGRCLDADRRADPGRGRAGRRGHRGDPEHDRHVRHARDPRRARHRAGPHRRPRPACPGLEGADPAPRRPGRRGLRAARPGRGGGHVRRLVRRRPGTASHARADLVHRGPRHRLPVRDGAGHADRDHGRDRSRRRGRHPHPRRRGARDRPPGRHGRPRQDRDADGRPPVGRRRS